MTGPLAFLKEDYSAEQKPCHMIQAGGNKHANQDYI